MLHACITKDFVLQKVQIMQDNISCDARMHHKRLCFAYHRIQNEAQGEESIPTFFLHRHANRPYHIDYAFAAPERIRDCHIETSTNWLAISDHRPLILEIED